ncbi:MAG: hypothetical protein WC340_05205 [Kiritimatiellia bacterium]
MNFINRILLVGLMLSAANVLKAQESAAQWADRNCAALEGITEVSLNETLRQGASALQALLVEVKTDGASDPVAVTRIAAMTQYVMRKGASTQQREAYADALLQAAEAASAADVVCFFLDQLRWCGLPQQAKAIQKLENSEDSGIAALAAITAQSVGAALPAKFTGITMTRCAQLNRDLAALKPELRMAALLEAFADPVPAYAGVALTWARSTGGSAETRTWAAKLPDAAGAHKIMLLDMLGARGDKAAASELIDCMSDDDDEVANTAQRAMLQLDQTAFASVMDTYLKHLPPNRQTMTRDNLRFLKTADLIAPLTANYASFSEPGKRVALELLCDRRVNSVLPIGLAAIDAAEDGTAILGFRLLREIATPAEAKMLVKRLLLTNDKQKPEAQTAYAMAARRDTSGIYTSRLLDTLATASDTQKPVLLETAARIGGDKLLSVVQEATAAPDVGVARAAVRALVDWIDNASLPALLCHAVTAPDAHCQTLAFRGASNRLEAKGVDKKPYNRVWREIRGLPGNEEHKQALEELLQ